MSSNKLTLLSFALLRREFLLRMGMLERLRCLWAFSIITTAASTIAPTAIAMPPSDMILAFTPW